MSKFRLSPFIKPESYSIQILPFLDHGIFQAIANIKINVIKSAESVSVHYKNYQITRAQINDEDAECTISEETETITLKFPNKQKRFDAGSSYKLLFDYRGELKNALVGFYTTTYTSMNAIQKIAATKFQPTYARQAFPCFDEPNFKARFSIAILKPINSTALSNYPIDKIDSYDSNYDLVSFQETLPMSTYLVCFVISNFVYNETTFKNDDAEAPLRLYATPENLHKTEYAADFARKVMEYYVSYFGIKYPLPKLDMAAIPDYVSGATEHWGLVTYKETSLFYTEQTHSTLNKERVALVVAHELAHNWFGNLVTTNWWNDLWLNEGFASYIQYKGVDAVEPEWKIMNTFQTSVLNFALAFDSKLSSHPIVQSVDTPDEITAIFDVISYSKGASILRMLEDVIGEKDFKRALTRFLNLHAYANAETKNFLREIEVSVDNVVQVMSMMDTFLNQAGYPIINVSFDANSESYRLTQERFLIDSDDGSNPKKHLKYKWTIPIKFITSEGNKSDPIFFNHTAENLTIIKPKNLTWIKFNPNQMSYYRVNYEKKEWENLIEHYSQLNTLDRTHLLEDAFSIAEAGLLNYNIPFDMSKHLINESEYGPWKVASIKFEQIGNYLTGSEPFKKYVNGIVEPVLTSIGLDANEKDDHLKKLSRVTLIDLACKFENEFYLKEIQVRFDKWIQNTVAESVSPDIRALVYKYGAMNISEETWLKLLEIYRNETDANEKLKLLNGLAYLKNETLLLKLLELTNEEGFIRDQDYFTLLAYMSENPYGTNLVWNYVRENWEKIVDKFTLNNRYLGQMIVAITKKFTTVEKLTEMENFFDKYPNAGAGVVSRSTAVSTVKSNISWLGKYRKIVEESINTLVMSSKNIV